MATYTYINGNLETLAGILDDSGYFDTVTYDSETKAITCSIGAQTVLSWYKPSTIFNISVHGSVSSYTSNITSSGNANVYGPIDAYQCSGGLAIVCGSSRVVITKHQRGETTVIFGAGSSTSAAMASIGAISCTDTGTFANYTTNSYISSHTLLIPICSCAAFDTESYTTTVLLSAYKQFTTVGFLTYNNKRYFFDGYFATEDTETSGGAS